MPGFAQGQGTAPRCPLGRRAGSRIERPVPLTVRFASSALTLADVPGEGARVLRDLGLCLAGTLAGVRLDGAVAYRAMQSICGQAPFDLAGKLALHFTLLPATSAIMLAVAAACLWRPAEKGASASLRLAWLAKVAALFLGMLIAMSLAEWPVCRLLPLGTGSAVLGALAGMAGFVLALHGARIALERAGLIVPACCR